MTIYFVNYYKWNKILVAIFAVFTWKWIVHIFNILFMCLVFIALARGEKEYFHSCHQCRFEFNNLHNIQYEKFKKILFQIAEK